MRIGDAAAAAGMTPRALRYYEQQGLVTARRTPSGHRVYDAEDIHAAEGGPRAAGCRADGR